MKALSRIERLRNLMDEENLDAIVVSAITDLMWLTGFEYVFDFEQAHVAFITKDECVIHTDCRYSTAMKNAAKSEGLWIVDDKYENHSEFIGRLADKRSLSACNIAIDKMTPLAFYKALKKRLPDAQFIERENDIFKLRGQKDLAEIENIKLAQACAEAGFKEMLSEIHEGMTEREVSLILEFAMRKNGADELSFPNIVASGPNSANPHAIPSNRKLKSGDLVVFDFGARINGYCSDTTRTISIGKPSEEQKRIYNAVRLANEEVEKSLHAGVTGKQMHILAEEVLQDAGFGGKMGHALGHGVGLNVHENPTLSPKAEAALEEGSIVTVEPGVYISGENGVRLEDFGCVKASSFDNFCKLPHDMYILE